MKRDQFIYFIYPSIYFIVKTFNQWRAQEPITWGDNTLMLGITIVIIYLMSVLINWAKKPYQWGKKDN